MAHYALVASSVANTAAAATAVHDAVVTNMGWTLHDDQSGASPPYYVFSSTGENSDRSPGYLWMRWSSVTDELEFRLYMHWDNSGHSGTVALYNSVNTRVGVDDNGSFTLWVYGNKDHVQVITKVGSAYEGVGTDYLDFFYSAYGTTQGAVTSGSSKTVTLDTDEGANFIVGQQYQIAGIGDGEGREWPTVTAISTDTLTLDSLTRGYGAGATVGTFAYKWMIAKRHGANYYVLPESTEGTADYTTAAGITDISAGGALFDPNRATGKYSFYHTLMNVSNQTLIGITTMQPHLKAGTGYEDTVSVEEVDSGTSTGSNTSTTLNDTGQSWSTDEYDGYCLIITNGTSAGEMREIASNTSTELTVTAAWTVTPDATSDYVICKKGYRYFYLTGQYYAFKEIDGGV